MRTRGALAPLAGIGAAAAGLALAHARPAVPTGPATPAGPMAVETAASQPLYFEQNRGQAGPGVQFVGRGPGYSLLLKGTETELVPTHRAAGERPVRLRLVGARPKPSVRTAGKQAGYVNYLRGSDSSRWQTGVPLYGRVRFHDVYPGVDVVHYGNGEALEHDFVVRPGVDPAQIRLAVDGAEQVSLTPEGDLTLRTPSAELIQRKPIAYQEIHGRRVPIPCSYRLDQGTEWENGRMGAPTLPFPHSPIPPSVQFEVGPYDKTRPLVIDPVIVPKLVFSTYFGHKQGRSALGTRGEVAGFPATHVAKDDAGNSYFVGSTTADNFPATAGAYQDELAGDSDMFVAKIDVNGTLVWATYLGGERDDFGASLAVGPDGSVYVVGDTISEFFPATDDALQGPYDDDHLPPTGVNGVLARLRADGKALLYGTYLAGNGNAGSPNAGDDTARGVAVAANGEVVVVGATRSDDFLAPHAALSRSGLDDAFVVRIAANGSLVSAVLLGGEESDQAEDVTLAPDGEACVVGNTLSITFPVTPDAEQGTIGGHDNTREHRDAFLVRVGTNGDVAYATYQGGTGDDTAHAVTADADGNYYVVGETDSPEDSSFGPNLGVRGGSSLDAFAQRVARATGRRTHHKRFGGSQEDSARGVSLDAFGRMLVTGFTASSNFPTTGVLQPNKQGGSDAFVAQLTLGPSSFGRAPSGLEFAYSTFLGGSGNDFALGAAEVGGRVHLVGGTESANFPLVRPIQSKKGASREAFVSRVADGAGAPRLSPAQATLRARVGTVGAATFTVRNAGRDRLSGLVRPLKAPFRVAQGSGPFGLEPGGSLKVRVEFQARAKKTYRQTLVIPTGAVVGGRVVDLKAELVGIGR